MLHTNTNTLVKHGPNSNGLDESVTVIKNSIGFRGPEPPRNFNDHLTIITVGGSTTECIFVAEEKTWPHLLSKQLQSSFNNVWVNNAGLNGHSTYGHLKLMEEYIVKLRPDYCLFLVGCNDVDRPDLTPSDSTINNENQKFFLKLAQHSVLVNVSLNFYRHRMARRRQLINNRHFSLQGQEKLIVSDSVIGEELKKRTSLVKQYGDRIKQLIALSRRSGIDPIFITQPCLLGDTTDDVTGINLGTFPFNEGNGKLKWALLELYNDETRTVCRENNVLVIDLAVQLPKSSRYFYDVYHFNNEGCRKVSALLYDSLNNYFARKSPQHVRN